MSSVVKSLQPCPRSLQVFSRLPKSATSYLCLLLVVATLALYNPVNRHPFVNYDDDRYVTENAHVHNGVTWDTITWAFSVHRAGKLASAHLAVARARLSAVSPEPCRTPFHQPADSRRERRSSIFVSGIYATGRVGPSLFVAALFALHPINVESVAWVAERKNVLSTFFFFAALIAYCWYARKPDWRRYLAFTGLFVFGLMSKPMVITLPFVLLLLDYWPLGRIRGSPAGTSPIAQAPLSKLVVEKTAPARSLRRQRRDHHAGPASGRGRALHRAIFARRPSGKCAGGLRHVFVEDDLAVASGAALSSSGRFAGGVAVGDRRVLVLLAVTGVVLKFRAEAISADRLAVVSRDSGAGHRTGAGRRPGHGRPLCLHSAGWNLCDDRLGSRGSGRFATDRPGCPHDSSGVRSARSLLSPPIGNWATGRATTISGRTRSP